MSVIIFAGRGRDVKVKSKYLCLYEKLFPDQPMDGDPRASAIKVEMKAVIDAPDNKTATNAIAWWGWNSPQEMHSFVRKARKMWLTL